MKLYEYAAAGLPVVYTASAELCRLGLPFAFPYRWQDVFPAAVRAAALYRETGGAEMRAFAEAKSWRGIAERILDFRPLRQRKGLSCRSGKGSRDAPVAVRPVEDAPAMQRSERRSRPGPGTGSRLCGPRCRQESCRRTPAYAPHQFLLTQGWPLDCVPTEDAEETRDDQRDRAVRPG